MSVWNMPAAPEASLLNMGIWMRRISYQQCVASKHFGIDEQTNSGGFQKYSLNTFFRK
jgi:hypothetical protein